MIHYNVKITKDNMSVVFNQERCTTREIAEELSQIVLELLKVKDDEYTDFLNSITKSPPGVKYYNPSVFETQITEV